MLECAKSRPFALRGPASFLLITWPLFSVPYWTFVSTWKIEEKSHAGWKYRRLFLEGMDITPSTFLWPQLKSIATLNATPWTIESMDFSRLEYWSGLTFPSPGDLSSPEIKSRSPALQVDSLPAKPQGKPLGRPGHLIWLQVDEGGFSE